jgi:hypothetical protein
MLAVGIACMFYVRRTYYAKLEGLFQSRAKKAPARA